MSINGSDGYSPPQGYEYPHSMPFVSCNDLSRNLLKAVMTVEIEDKKPYNVFAKPSTVRQKAISDGCLISTMLKKS